MIQRARDFDLGVDILAFSQQGQGLAIKHHLQVGKTTGAGTAQFVRPGESDCAGTCQCQSLLIFGDHFKDGVVVERYIFLR
ncbi:hypothetical protein D3C81_1673840 [compost metagenome]